MKSVLAYTLIEGNKLVGVQLGDSPKLSPLFETKKSAQDFQAYISDFDSKIVEVKVLQSNKSKE